MEKKSNLVSPIGLIAGNGHFPIEFAKGARDRGLSIVAVAHLGESDPALEELVDHITWIKVGQLGKIIKVFKRKGVKQAAFAGGLARPRLFDGFRPDLKGMLLMARLRSLKDDVVLRAISAEIESHEISIFSACEVLTESVPKSGLYSRRFFSASELEDAIIGWECAREIGRLDVGQTVIVKKKTIVAVEAVEGTDRAILRAGELCGTDFTVVKLCKPQQDTRFDQPTVGVKTIETMIKAGGSALVLEAEKSLLLHPDEVVQKADAADIALVVAASEEEMKELASGGRSRQAL
ncbi:MAG: UDP-2,3-diacylglucosamine diphosphatase LpxI [Deltaproteobacteria bacterium]|nr:UDP-2,3-diacylglucosamine diphosphatase LpxI [Deltaproteobacteria bacterium]